MQRGRALVVGRGRSQADGKRRGEMAEAAFVAKVSSLGFGVAKPWGDSDPYDFIVETKQIIRGKRSGWFDKLTISSRDSDPSASLRTGSARMPQFRQEARASKVRSLTPPKRLKLARVQVKSAHVAGADGCYSFRAHGHAQSAYTKEEIDVLVAYVVPEDAWYVFSVSVVQGVRSLKLYAGSRKRRSRFEKYREAWWVFGGG